MSLSGTPEAVRPPVALGCFFAAAAVAIVVLFGLFAIKFIESGANDGKVRLEVPEAYAPGSIAFVGTSNFFIVRLNDGTFLALSDLDAANRANQARRCRVNLTDLTDPSLGVGADALSGRMSAAASGSTAVIRETCNGAIYDIAGIRLNGEGANLDRFPLSVDSTGHLDADTSQRQCSERTAANTTTPRRC